MSSIGTVYGQALYDLAKDEGLDALILQQLCALDEGFSAEPDYIRLLCSANLSKDERVAVLDEGFRGKVDGNLLNFMKLLAEKGYMRHFSACRKAYQSLYNTDHGILEVKAVTAVALTQEQACRLAEKLSAITGKTVQLNNRVDPETLGGVRLDYDGKRVDGTVQHRLDSIGKLLANTVL